MHVILQVKESSGMSKFRLPSSLNSVGDVATTLTPTPDMVADLMTKQTQRVTHERHVE